MTLDAAGIGILLRALGRRVPLARLVTIRIATEALHLTAPAGFLVADSATAALLDTRCGVPVAEGAVIAIARKWLVTRSHAAYILLGAFSGAAALAGVSLRPSRRSLARRGLSPRRRSLRSRSRSRSAPGSGASRRSFACRAPSAGCRGAPYANASRAGAAARSPSTGTSLASAPPRAATRLATLIVLRELARRGARDRPDLAARRRTARPRARDGRRSRGLARALHRQRRAGGPRRSGRRLRRALRSAGGTGADDRGVRPAQARQGARLDRRRVCATRGDAPARAGRVSSGRSRCRSIRADAGDLR